MSLTSKQAQTLQRCISYLDGWSEMFQVHFNWQICSLGYCPTLPTAPLPAKQSVDSLALLVCHTSEALTMQLAHNRRGIYSIRFYAEMQMCRFVCNMETRSGCGKRQQLSGTAKWHLRQQLMTSINSSTPPALGPSHQAAPCGALEV